MVKRRSQHEVAHDALKQRAVRFGGWFEPVYQVTIMQVEVEAVYVRFGDPESQFLVVRRDPIVIYDCNDTECYPRNGLRCAVPVEGVIAKVQFVFLTLGIDIEVDLFFQDDGGSEDTIL